MPSGADEMIVRQPLEDKLQLLQSLGSMEERCGFCLVNSDVHSSLNAFWRSQWISHVVVSMFHGDPELITVPTVVKECNSAALAHFSKLKALFHLAEVFGHLWFFWP
jgi:hypothetical protein